MKHFLLIGFVFLLGTQAIAQPTNSNCSTAFEIPDPTDYCSSFGEFNNNNAGDSGLGAATCFNNANNDVWFRFVARAKAINITVTGNSAGQMSGGTLVQPEVALYDDNGCNGAFFQRQCDSDATNDGAASVSQGGLTIGQSYLIRIDGRGNAQGTFTICTKNFNPPVTPGQDCNTAAVLCDKSSFIVDALSGGGADDQEFIGIPCQTPGSNFTEMDATWFRWTCETTGTLTFTLDPLIPGDDIDWALFELPNGIDDCSTRIHLRCAFNSPDNMVNDGNDCGDLTGLNAGSNDTAEDPGCEDNAEDGFVEQITMTAGTSYTLGINNFTTSNIGFEITFGGSGTFVGPTPAFTIDPLEGLRCDTFFTVTNNSFFDPMNGEIVSYDWNFGERAIPPTGTGEGPFQVNYESFGDKFISLTVESDRGCIVTEILELFAEPCCDDVTDIGIDPVNVVDLVCATIPNGSIEVEGINGSPEYEYSIDGGTFNQNNFFGNLDAGTFQINVQDIKGCTDSIDVVITSPPELMVDAGPDVTVDLCSETQLNGTYTPMNPSDMIMWNAADTSDNFSLSCLNCLDPIAIAPGQTTYILTVEDQVGCSASDELTISVIAEYPIYGPNIFTPNGDGIHERFTIYGGKEAVIIREFYIYDRWGSLIFFNEDMPLNDPMVGWDGFFKDDMLQSQVLVWFARIEFCDATGPTDTRNYSGEFTLAGG